MPAHVVSGEGEPEVVKAPAKWSRVEPGQHEVSAEQEALQGGVESPLAARLKAKAAQLKRRRQAMDVPPDDVWNGELVALVKPIDISEGQSFAAFIVDATDCLFIHDADSGDHRREGHEFIPDDTGQWKRLAGWGEVGELMGLAGDGVTLGQIVTAVCGSREVLGGFAERIIAFVMGRKSAIERALGE